MAERFSAGVAAVSTKIIVIIIIVLLSAIARKGTRWFCVFRAKKWKFPVLDLGALIEMRANMLHSLIPCTEEDSTEATLTWPVAVDRKAPTLGALTHIFHAVMLSEMSAEMVFPSEGLPILPCHFALQVMRLGLAQDRKWNKAEGTHWISI
jgi:hypothetical protein